MVRFDFFVLSLFFFLSCKAVISFSSSQSPLITIVPGGSSNRSGIRFSSSPNSTKPNFKEIRISRPDSPSISINRQRVKNKSHICANGNDNTFHISLGTPTNTNQKELSVSSPPSSIHMWGRTSPVKLKNKNENIEKFNFQSLHQIETHCASPIDSRFTSNIVTNRFKPLMIYASPNSNKSSVLDNSERRSPSVVNLPPTASRANPTPFSLHAGNIMKRDLSDIDHLSKLLIKSMNPSNEPNLFG